MLEKSHTLPQVNAAPSRGARMEWERPVLRVLQAKFAENNTICIPDGQGVPRDEGHQTCS